MKFVRVHNLETRYYTAGIGPRDVLFVHGWAASGRMWLRSMWALRHSYHTWALDLPGFGNSEAPADEWTSTEQYTDHVAAFCELVGVKPYAVVGHSMGGRIIFDLARRYPHLVGRLVAVAPMVTGRLGFNLNVFMFGDLGETLGVLARRIWPVATAGALSTYWAPRYLGSEGVRRTADDMRRTAAQAAIGSLRAMTNQDYSPYLADISQPALVICGRRDYTIPPSDSRLAAEKLPLARLVMLEHVHHWPTDEDPLAFLWALKGFLADGLSEAVT